MDQISKHTVSIPDYTLGEEICNAVTHGLGALLSAAALTLLAIRARGALPIITVTLFGVAMIQLYTVSCVYHALSPSLAGKKVMRVIDHCNVYLLVFGTYLPWRSLPRWASSSQRSTWIAFRLRASCAICSVAGRSSSACLRSCGRSGRWGCFIWCWAA